MPGVLYARGTLSMPGVLYSGLAATNLTREDGYVQCTCMNMSIHVLGLLQYQCSSDITTKNGQFRSVVVITFASHAKGPGFETQRNQLALPSPSKSRDGDGSATYIGERERERGGGQHKT